MPGHGLRRRAVVIGVCLSVALLTTVAVGLGRSSPPDPPSSVASTDGQSAVDSSGSRLPPLDDGPSNTDDTTDNQVPAHPADAIDDLLDARAAALRDGDRDAWLAALDAPSASAGTKQFIASQSRAFDRLSTLRPVSWSYQVVGGSALPKKRRAALGGIAWLADVQLDYQLIAGGPQVRREQFLTIVRRAGAWRISTDTDGPTSRDVWDLGPISHASAKRCLVIGAAARRAQVAQLAAECEGEARRVDLAWGRSWPRRTVITVPNTLPQLATLLGRTSAGKSTAGLARTAAVTIGRAGAAADGVLINGVAFDQLSAVGRRVVVTHELVHVATRATGSRSAPTWLEEGFADYVAYQDTGLAAKQVAGDALNEVRAGRVPARLPSTNDFNAAGNKAAAAYGQAWVAVQVIADRAGGGQRLKAFYQQAAAASSADASAGAESSSRQAILDAALTRIGLRGTTALVAAWQSRLRRLAQ
jgi:hypothetical protein